MKIYLAGGIFNLTDNEKNNWRNIVIKNLSEDFEILNPMRRNFKDEKGGKQ